MPCGWTPIETVGSTTAAGRQEECSDPSWTWPQRYRKIWGTTQMNVRTASLKSGSSGAKGGVNLAMDGLPLSRTEARRERRRIQKEEKKSLGSQR